MHRLCLLLALFSASCSYAVTVDNVPGTGARLHCHRVHDECPADDDIAAELVAFSGWVPGFEVDEELNVEFYDHDQTWDLQETYGVVRAVGFTSSPYDVSVVGMDVLTHELMHVQFWRTTGDGDANHADPPGPWNDYTKYSIDGLNAAAAWRAAIR